jgi:4-hydroxybenzoate polyprenyltransferase
MSRARAWLEIVRISNAPTVVSNAIAGAVLGTIARIVEDDGGLGGVFAGGIPYRAGDDAPSSTAVLAALIAPLLAYLGGMVLNDAFDSAVAAGFALLAGAMLASTLLAPMALAATVLLCGAIVVYDRFHTKSVASTMLLALCRALASLIPMLAMSDGDIEMLARRGALALPLALAAWTLGLSIVARSEAKAIQASDDRPRLLGCIRCGQLMPSEAGTCPECGSGSDHAARMARLDRRRQPTSILRGIVPMAGTLAILAALLVALTTVMHHGGRSRHDPLEKLPPLGVAIAIVCIALSSRALIAMRRDPRATPAAVGTWIACLALVDAMALGIAGAWLASAACVGLAGWTLLLQRRIAGS